MWNEFGKNDDLVILWSDIKMIGEEVILVDIPPIKENKLKK